jgi:hypothetical protein
MNAVLWFGRGRVRYAVLCALAWLPAAAAQAQAGVQPGNYRCWSYNVSGGAGNCRLAVPIAIRADGTYSESSAQGKWRASGDRITFSESKIRGPGVVSGNRIVFEYDYGGRHHTVTYLCQDCSGGGARPAGGAAAPGDGALVWVQVKLTFDRHDGYLGWANSAHLVPAAQAVQFAAAPGTPTPTGSATGIAYAGSSYQIVANFRQAMGGQRYVVFLDSGRERLAVATVDVPAAPAEQTIAVDASLRFGASGAQGTR